MEEVEEEEAAWLDFAISPFVAAETTLSKVRFVRSNESKDVSSRSLSDTTDRTTL